MHCPGNSPVRLAPFEILVENRYRDIETQNPALGRNLSAADPDEMRAWYDNGQVHAIAAQDRTVGCLAVAPGAIEWIEGYEIKEEVITTTHTGNGYADAAQAVWAADCPAPDRLVIGTIDGRNIASRRTAEPAGRKPVLAYVFLKLPVEQGRQ
ncbi:hypothetical protein [Ruegeria sp.]|uniref:hypothetical protein n=1 Tax=Ruegeria sp. TaxID=1879320 RepID=UPI003C7A5F20